MVLPYTIKPSTLLTGLLDVWNLDGNCNELLAATLNGTDSSTNTSTNTTVGYSVAGPMAGQAAVFVMQSASKGNSLSIANFSLPNGLYSIDFYFEADDKTNSYALVAQDGGGTNRAFGFSYNQQPQ